MSCYNSDDIYWRLGAILSSICSFFSVFVVLYFLVIREHPDRPDETDPNEREKFFDIKSNNGNNLWYELYSKITVNLNFRNLESIMKKINLQCLKFCKKKHHETLNSKRKVKKNGKI